MKNFLIRTVAGLIYVAIVLCGICLHAYLFLLVFAAFLALALWELYGLLDEINKSLPEMLLNTISGVYLFYATFVYASGLFSGHIFLPYLFYLMYVFIKGLYSKAPNPLKTWAYTLLPQVYVAGFFSLLNFLVFKPNPSGMAFYTPVFVLAMFVFVWLNDTGAYLVGSRFGRRRLFERISPKKSWEGFWGGVAFTLASSQVFAYYVPSISWYNWLGLSAVIVAFGTWGDLTESLLKRTLHIKDSGNLIPGHGGILDRFDSTLMAIPAMYIYIELFIRN